MLISTLVAALAAAVILVAFVLPAEYAIDPLGIGRLVGLDALGTSKASKPITEVMHAHPRKYLQRQHPDRRVRLAKSWNTRRRSQRASRCSTRGACRADRCTSSFTASRPKANGRRATIRSYEIQQSASEAHGSFIAPFTGQHGWYWRNLSDEPAIITLQASGYYSRLGRIESKKAERNQWNRGSCNESEHIG